MLQPLSPEAASTHTPCSLKKSAPGTGIWTRALVTHPEGSDHPYIIGRTGDCPSCILDLIDLGNKMHIPCEIIVTGDSGDFCHCEQCAFMSRMIWGSMMQDFDVADPHNMEGA